MRAAVVVLNYNGWEDTFKCLASIEAQSKKPFQMILVDNGSKDDHCAEVHSRYPKVRLHRNRENRGFAGGSNDGLKMALDGGADYVFLLNNDTVISPAAIELLTLALESQPEWGIIGPIINYMEEPGKVRTAGCLFNIRWSSGLFTEDDIRPSEAGFFVAPTDIVNGCAMAIRREVLERIGFFDESYFIVHEESDFCLRTLKAGFRNGILNRVLVWHKGSSSFQRQGKEYQRYYDSRNLLYLLKSHGRINNRPARESYFEYLRYVYYRYCHEVETGNISAALACMDGLVDAVFGHTGPRRTGRASMISRLAGAGFESIRRINRTTPRLRFGWMH
jgi:GT2 family glycosyltransferase